MPSPPLHQSLQPLVGGAPLARARAAIVLVHGRGGDADGMLDLGRLVADEQVALVALQAANNSWYPERFMAPLATNEPWLSSALQSVSDAMQLILQGGLPLERVMLLGFSQGACLSVEFGARNAVRYGALVALAGGLIGPDGTPRTYTGSLAATPVFLGRGDRDPHIPVARVQETSRVLTELGADVDTRVYPGLGHVIVDDEVNAVRALARQLV